MGDLLDKLETSRKELLDLGLRNSLLNFREGARSLRIVDEIAAEVFRLLIDEQKRMSFSPTEFESDEASDEIADDLLLISDSSDEISERHTDTKLQTRKSEDALHKSLLKIHTEANSYEEEQGINVLYLALGFLEWFEDANSQLPRRAPLLLVPVELERGSARETFTLQWANEELEPNLSLAAKLKAEFGLELPLFPEEGLQPQSYFHEVQESVSSQQRWNVRENDIQLGFFSFGKFRMYKDLQHDIWPEGTIDDHEVITALLGDGFAERESRFDEEQGIDGQVDPAEIHFVKDADSTQTIAALEVMTGKHMVIQGPPGTGKSQTITNIIAECLGQNKTVLFVAEKMAALEVVKRRLDEVHLGDGVLELHSHKSKKKEVLEELSRTLNLGRPNVDDSDDDLRALRESRDKLNNYCVAANEEILKSGVTFVQALGHCLSLKRKWEELPVFHFTPMENWTPSDFRERVDFLGEAANHIDAYGAPNANVFFASNRRSFSPTHQSRLSEDIAKTIRVIDELDRQIMVLSESLGFSSSWSLDSALSLVRAADRAFNAPELDDISLEKDEWQKQRDKIRELLRLGAEIAATHKQLDDVVISAAWQADLIQTRQSYMVYGEKWWKFLSLKYRRAKGELLGLCKNGLPDTSTECLGIIDGILDTRVNREAFGKQANLGSKMFGSHWQGESSDWEVLALVAEWVIALYHDIGEGDIPEELVEFLSGSLDREGLDEKAIELATQIEKVTKRMNALQEQLELEGVEFGSTNLAQLKQMVTTWQDHVDDIYHQVRYRKIQDEARAHGLEFLIPAMDAWALPGEALVDTLKLSYHEGLADKAYETKKAIQSFDRSAHELQIERFQKLDQLQMFHAQGKLAMKHFESIPNMSGGGQIGIISRETNKKRRHLPIRKLMAQAGEAIQKFKPVFMMSPMSIAQYLAPNSVSFDVVIFDEASQVKTVDAFGAILRGKQVVVVGDTKQMPPTDFFSRGYEADESEDSATGDIESILGLFLSSGAPQSMLQWHYRSRHESLIAVSNYEFYENKLVVFPSSGSNQKATGLHFHHLANSVYDRGGSRTNKEEAKFVAQQVMQHAQNHPEMTLGVVAFSTAQRDMILLHLEQLRRADDRFEEFFSSSVEEPFFVKNLENVQGDERDVIMISIGYGRDANGKLSASFGPLNREGGQRRLNVLISRAKQVMHVFANFRADDLQTLSTSPFGVRALKHFMSYAENRQLDIPQETGKSPDSPFEEEVIAALRSEGFDVEPQVGTAGYFIDLAIRHPERPGEYLLAVECDGASYHSSLSARDRDRLRQSVLEGLGWRFHRIWSTDWFRNSATELERLKVAINEALTTAPVANVVEVKTTTIDRSSDSAQDQHREVVFYQATAIIPEAPITEIHLDSASSLAKMIHQVVLLESPIHVDVATRRVLEAYAVNRAGGRIKTAITDAIRLAERKDILRKKGDFLYKLEQTEFPYRDRSLLDTAERKAQYVAPEEWQAAIIDVINNAFEIEQDELVSNALNLLGFQRATEAVKNVVVAEIQALAKTGTVEVQDTRCRLSSELESSV